MLTPVLHEVSHQISCPQLRGHRISDVTAFIHVTRHNSSNQLTDDIIWGTFISPSQIKREAAKERLPCPVFEWV